MTLPTTEHVGLFIFALMKKPFFNTKNPTLLNWKMFLICCRSAKPNVHLHFLRWLVKTGGKCMQTLLTEAFKSFLLVTLKASCWPNDFLWINAAKVSVWMSPVLPRKVPFCRRPCEGAPLHISQKARLAFPAKIHFSQYCVQDHSWQLWAHKNFTSLTSMNTLVLWFHFCPLVQVYVLANWIMSAVLQEVYEMAHMHDGTLNPTL